MALVQINWRPDRKTLVDFSQAALFFLGMVACPLALYRGQVGSGVAFWVAAVACRAVGMTRPEWLRPVFVGLSLITWPIGWVVSHVTLAVVFYLVLTPVALVFRLIGRDALGRRFDRQATSYWEAYNPNQGQARYFRQF